jgi:surface protein
MIGIPIPKSTITGEIEIDWGDNTEIEKFNSLSETDYPQHLFSNDIDKSIIQIRYGNFTHFGFINDTVIDNNLRMPYIDRLIKVTSWGDYKITHFNHAFNGATNLIYVPETIPNDVVSMSFMFYDATNFNSDISRWDTSNVTNMHSMFYYADIFNRDISRWDTGSVTRMNSMFYNATKFNQDITKWDTSNVMSMNSMFDRAIDFNQNIGKWNISKVTNMNAIFSNKLITADIYSQILIGWNTNNAPDGLNFNGATGITVNNERTAYINDINAVDASNSLKSKGWTFNPIPTFTNNEPMSNIKKIEGYSNSKLAYYAKHIK